MDEITFFFSSLAIKITNFPRFLGWIEIVRVAKKYLEDHPEEARKYGNIEHKKLNPSVGEFKIGSEIISRFLGWNETERLFVEQPLYLNKLRGN